MEFPLIYCPVRNASSLSLADGNKNFVSFNATFIFNPFGNLASIASIDANTNRHKTLVCIFIYN